MVVLVYVSCKEDSIVFKESSNFKKTTKADTANNIGHISLSTITKDTIKAFPGIGPLREDCNTPLTKYFYEFDHYIPVAGKRVGILPKEEILSSYSYYLDTFIDTLGYSFINVSGEHIHIARSKYNDQHIALSIEPLGNWQVSISSFPNLWAYYIDEPISGWALPSNSLENTFRSIKNYMNNHGSSTSNLIGGETFAEKAHFFDQNADRIMCTRYYDVLGEILAPDQRGMWTDFRNNFGSKFSDTWISATQDKYEYDQLIGHAKNLGLDGIWFYQREDGQLELGAMERIRQFSFYAFKWGYLKRVDRMYKYTYRCLKALPCDCDRDNITDGWTIISREPTPTYRTYSY